MWLVLFLQTMLGGTEQVPDAYIGTFNATTGEGKSVHVQIFSDDTIYFFCNQDMAKYKPLPSFPPIPSKQTLGGGEWMIPGQEHFSIVYGYTAVVVLVAVLLVSIRKAARNIIRWFYIGDQVGRVNSFGIFGHISRNSHFHSPFLLRPWRSVYA